MNDKFEAQEKKINENQKENEKKFYRLIKENASLKEK